MVWAKLTTAFNICGALLAVPAGAAALYTAYQNNFSTDAACRSLRGSILSTLEKNVDAKLKRVLVHEDMTKFEHSCALNNPDAQEVFAALDSQILFPKGSEAKNDPLADGPPDSRPVNFGPPRLPPFYRFSLPVWQRTHPTDRPSGI